MKVATTRFGELEITEEQIYTLVTPIPGFPATKSFFFIQKEKIAPFQWMQSIEESGVTFVVVEPRHFFHDYFPKIGMTELKEIGLDKVEESLLMAIVVLPEDMTKMTANLRGPLVINSVTRAMKQVFIENERWTVREFIVEGIRRKEQFALSEKAAEEGKP
ncbi:MAG: flagellar assembly protein FliW [bacterium]